MTSSAPVASSSKPAHLTNDTVTAAAKTSHSIDELAAMFSSEDWEELYANVDVINSTSGQEFLNAWANWAEFKGKQSVDQWQQYYEKVVLPQWLIDPESKRQLIKEKIKKKHQDEDSSGPRQPVRKPPEQPQETTASASTTLKKSSTVFPTSSVVQKPAETEVAKFEQLLAAKQNLATSAAYVYFAREKQSSTWADHPTLDHSKYMV